MKRKVSGFVMAFIVMLSFILASVPVASAASVYIRPKKSVYLVMDDSGSMGTTGTNDANYALQTFLAVLDKDEEVNIYFLNGKQALGSIDFLKKSNDMIKDVRVRYPASVGGTPFNTVKEAAEDMRKAVAKDDTREYWLVVITDGGFNEGIDPQNYMENFTNTALKNGSYPNFLYVGIGGGQRFTVPQGAENRFFLESSYDIIEAMRNAVIHITDRQVLTATNADSKTINFTLNYPARNIVVLAQTYKTKITSYTAVSDINTGELYDIEYPATNPHLQYSTVAYLTEKNGSSIKSGDISLTFDCDVDVSNVVVMVEPAIGINAVYLDEGGQPIKPQDMGVNEDVTVEMTLCDSETLDPLDLSAIFGSVDQYITINGTRYDGSKVTFTVPAKDLDISLVAEFADGFILDIHEQVTGLVEKREISLFVSDSGYFECDIDSLDSANGIVVTPLINGANLTAEIMKDTSLTISGGGLFTNRFDIVPDDSTGTYIIHPRAGLLKVFTPTDEQNFDITFTDVDGTTITETITVKITGDRHILALIGIVIGTLLGIALIIYLIIVEVTRVRFPKGAFIQYYGTDTDGKPDNQFGGRIYLNKPSLDKLKNGSYLPIPKTHYKVSGERNCAGLTFEAFTNSQIRICGVADITEEDEYGNVQETSSFVPINQDGDEVAANAPIDSKTERKSLVLLYGHYLRDKDNNGCVKITTNNHNN